MPKLTIDGRKVEVPPDTTILEAARKLGIEIPTLCHLEGYKPSTSCLVCMVRLKGEGGRLVPSCGTVAVDGMEVESETKEVHHLRRTALELLLSDHLGDCLAPCTFGCPANMDIPRMLRQIAAGDLASSVATVKRDIALPAVLGRICPAPCEKVCRRKDADGPVAIRRLKRFVADVDLASDDPYTPACKPATGKRVAIVGAGPTGLSAAYYLRQQGHACTIFDENQQPGGRLRFEPGEDNLPPEMLDAEIETILRLAVQLRTNTRIDTKGSLADLQNHFDAVLIACGNSGAGDSGLGAGDLTTVNKRTFQTDTKGTFAAGGAIRGKALVVRSVADGKEAAISINQYLCGQAVTGPQKPFSTRIGRMKAEELAQLLGPAAESSVAGGQWSVVSTPEEAAEQAARCLHCDCRASESCKLRKYAAAYGANPRRYKARTKRPFQLHTQHPEVIYEPGKCIDCGLCIEIAQAAGEPLGLTFVGRGFDVRIGVPFDRSLEEALKKVAAGVCRACPTGALTLKGEKSLAQSPILP